MDDADLTQQISEVYETAALKAHAARMNTVRHPAGHTGVHPQGARPVRNCEDCGRTIPHGRLAANPAAIRCVKCQTNLETGEAE